MPTVIFDSLSVPQKPPTTINFDGVCYVTATSGVTCFAAPTLGLCISFSTLATAGVSLRRVGLNLAAQSVGINGTCEVVLLANNPAATDTPAGIGPGADLIILGSISDTALTVTVGSATAAYKPFYFYSNFPLSPSTRYWIAIRDISRAAPETSCNLGLADWTGGGTGITGQYFYNDSGLNPNQTVAVNSQSQPYQMLIEVNP